MGTSATLQNSQCIISAAGSSVNASGNVLTVILAVTFQSAFAGAKNIYSFAQTIGGLNSGWQSLGTWTVPGGPPQALSVSPASGTGFSQSFTLVSSDPAGALDLATVLVLFNTGIAGPHACYVNIDALHGTLALVNDAGTAGLGPITLGTSATLQNSQCTVSAAGSSVNSSGNVLTVILAVTFQPAFAGTRTLQFGPNNWGAQLRMADPRDFYNSVTQFLKKAQRVAPSRNIPVAHRCQPVVSWD